jgi:hypothetical protein
MMRLFWRIWDRLLPPKPYPPEDEEFGEYEGMGGLG